MTPFRWDEDSAYDQHMADLDLADRADEFDGLMEDDK